MTLVSAAQKLAHAVNRMEFGEPVSRVYNPLIYAWDQHRRYLELYGGGTKKVLFLGMNPGPWGMAQTGVPFGEVQHVRDWLMITGEVGKPEAEHPKRPVEGLDCPRSEVSGRRLWSFFEEKFGAAGAFFKDHFVANYCPLVFMEESGRNRTPDKLRPEERDALFAACDEHLVETIQILEPEWLIGIGAFAAKRFSGISSNLPGTTRKIGQILHPSPASPAANRGWAEAAYRQLLELGVWKV